MLRRPENKAGVWAELRPSATTEDVADATPEDFGALRLKAATACQVLDIVVNEHCFALDAASGDLGDFGKLDTSFALSGKLSMVRAHLL